ncbi:hypothetical protein GUJ93_ZPchr0004g40353 [Zizania palustris]|uniref:Uncharacterized protein n=1 Tax=Zizania palustris TaxID=103762 RepID=A0A8J5S6U8_ZIZPA|nr:hypothetical protein GUJ93_ZPchr0004g40353 [Zizania palustris]
MIATPGNKTLAHLFSPKGPLSARLLEEILLHGLLDVLAHGLIPKRCLRWNRSGCDNCALPYLLWDLHSKPLLLLWKRHAHACGNPGPPPGLNLGLKVEDPPLLLCNLPLASLKLSLQALELLSLGLNLLPALTPLQSIHVIHRLHHTRHVDDGGVLLMLCVVEKAEGLPPPVEQGDNGTPWSVDSHRGHGEGSTMPKKKPPTLRHKNRCLPPIL